jgi:hypothetical protein
MQCETIAFPADADYHHRNEADSPTVLRVNGNAGRHACQLFSLSIGELGGEYDSLMSQRSITLTRKQVADLARHLVGLLAAQP